MFFLYCYENVQNQGVYAKGIVQNYAGAGRNIL